MKALLLLIPLVLSCGSSEPAKTEAPNTPPAAPVIATADGHTTDSQLRDACQCSEGEAVLAASDIASATGELAQCIDGRLLDDELRQWFASLKGKTLSEKSNSLETLLTKHGVSRCPLRAWFPSDKSEPHPFHARRGEAANKAAAEKSKEARQFVKKMSDSAKAFYLSSSASPKSFPQTSTAVTPPLGTCCSNDNSQCAADESLWNHPTWSELHFSVKIPHYYSYQYTTKDNGKSFTVSAFGDLDCDGAYSTFEAYGNIKDGQLHVGRMIYRDQQYE